MKTIEERVQRYCAAECPNASKEVLTLVCSTFKDGAKSEREELTRWHDPKWELPELLTPVLGKQSDGQKTYYKIVYRHEYDNEDGRYRWTDSEGCPIYVDGWREIHEL